MKKLCEYKDKQSLDDGKWATSRNVAHVTYISHQTMCNITQRNDWTCVTDLQELAMPCNNLFGGYTPRDF